MTQRSITDMFGVVSVISVVAPGVSPLCSVTCPDVLVCVFVLKKSNVIQLHVDTASQHGVGPKQKRTNGGKNKVYLGSAPGKDLDYFIYSDCLLIYFLPVKNRMH